jgi:hypothetical protein
VPGPVAHRRGTSLSNAARALAWRSTNRLLVAKAETRCEPSGRSLDCGCGARSCRRSPRDRLFGQHSASYDEKQRFNVCDVIRFGHLLGERMVKRTKLRVRELKTALKWKILARSASASNGVAAQQRHLLACRLDPRTYLRLAW